MWGNITRKGRGTTKQEKTLQSVTRGFPERAERWREDQGWRGNWGGGGGGCGLERQKEITVHEINILVSKGINKDSELSSVPGTLGMATEWIFATMVAGFLGFRTILLPYSQVQYTVYDIFNALSTCTFYCFNHR
jgi:hypothetical protein